MTTSELGKEAIKYTNNHGTSATVQLALYYLFLEQPDQAKMANKSFMSGAFKKQIAKDGSQPKDITLADGIHYSLMNLSLLMALGYLGDLVGVDVWNQKSLAGTTIEDAVKFLSSRKILPIRYKIAAEKYDEPGGKYLEAIQKIGQLPWKDNDISHLYIDFSCGFNGTKKGKFISPVVVLPILSFDLPFGMIPSVVVGHSEAFLL
ncbi:hypothetical protein IWQ61_002991 [Dispira simplex]|nr:hypothetical protein IWQ61_002991 [Dispira simplex]